MPSINVYLNHKQYMQIVKVKDKSKLIQQLLNKHFKDGD